MARNDLKTIRQYEFHAVYHAAFDRSELFLGDLPCLVMQGEHGVEVMALEYMSSNEWHDAIELYNNYQDDPRVAYAYSFKYCIEKVRKAPVDAYGMAILEELK